MKKDFDSPLLIYPCPIILVTSKYKGVENVLTVSWTGIASSHPEYITISINKKRFSHHLITESGCFVANIINQNLLESADYCGTYSGANHDKIKACEFTIEKAKTIDASLIMECPINIECKIQNIIQLGSHDLMIGKVTAKLIDNDISEKELSDKIRPVVYVRPNYYAVDSVSIGTFGKTHELIKNKQIDI